MKKRMISALLAFCMLASLLSVSAFAEGDEQTAPSAPVTQADDSGSSPTPAAPTPLTPDSVQALIDALPALDAYLEMDVEAQQGYAAKVTAITEALDTLSEEQKAGLTTTKYDTLQELLQPGAAVMDESTAMPPSTETPTPTPNEAGYYEIHNLEELLWFQGFVNSSDAAANAILMNDIAVTNPVLRDASPWTPMGTKEAPYKGTFDGNGKTLTCLTCDTATAEGVGLFGYVGAVGVVKNLNVADSTFTGKTAVGAICGQNKGTIENCTSSATVTVTATAQGSINFGGICGLNTGSNATITGCTSSATVTATGKKDHYIGGICGQNQSAANITGCTNNGTVNANGEQNYAFGGICGINAGAKVTLTGCTNSGAVNATDKGAYNIGGVCGQSKGTVADSTNSGAVSATGASSSKIGGVSGNNAAGTIETSTNTGSISATSEAVGGICGNNAADSIIKNCASNSAVTGSASVGGICGKNEATAADSISNCYYNNAVFTGDAVGSPGEGSDAISDTEGLPAGDFTSGKAAWLLNSVNMTDGNSETWAQGDNIPKLAKEDKSDAIYGNVYFQVNFDEDDEDESVTFISERYLHNGDPVAALPTGYLWAVMSRLPLNNDNITPLPSQIDGTDVLGIAVAALAIAPAPAAKAEGYSAGQTLSVTITAGNGESITSMEGMSYQWKKGGVSIPGATNITYTIPAGLAAGSYDYTCAVTYTEPDDHDGSLNATAALQLTGTTAPVTFTVTPAAAAPSDYTVNAWVNDLAGGVVSPMGITTHKEGENVAYTITPAKGYRVVKVLVDGVDVGAVSSYTFSGINRNHEIGVYFDKTSTTLRAAAPATGDDAAFAWWLLVMAVAAVGLGATPVLYRKKTR